VKPLGHTGMIIRWW